MGFIKTPQVHKIHWAGEAQGGKTDHKSQGRNSGLGSPLHDGSGCKKKSAAGSLPILGGVLSDTVTSDTSMVLCKPQFATLDSGGEFL